MDRSHTGNRTLSVANQPRPLSDNGASYIAGDLAEWLNDRGIRHVRGAPFHPQTQGKIERWHQTLKNRILLENYYLPGHLEAQLDGFVDYLQQPSLPRGHRQPDTRRRLLRARQHEKGLNDRPSNPDA